MDGFYTPNQLPQQQQHHQHQQHQQQHHHHQQLQQQQHQQRQHQQRQHQQQQHRLQQHHEQQLQQHHQQQQLQQQQQQQQQYHQQHQQYQQQEDLGGSQQMVPDHDMPPPGDSLDDIIQSNQTELYRRRSMSQSYGNTVPHAQPHVPRRMSVVGTSDMMAFGVNNEDIDTYQFNQHMSSTFPMDTTMSMSEQINPYMNPADYSGITADMMGSMIPSTFANMSVGQVGSQMAGDSPVMDLFTPTANSMPPPFPPNQLNAVTNDFSADLNPDDGPLSATPTNANTVTRVPIAPATTTTVVDATAEVRSGKANRPTSFDATETPQPQDTTTLSLNPAVAPDFDSSMSPLSRHVSAQSGVVVSPRANSQLSGATQPSTTTAVNTPTPTGTPQDSKEKTIYSKSGFDMLKALWLVATRKEPKINLGAVDMSCAFVVCDVTLNDCPIIYVSDNFQNLTGYSRHEIVGQNCRFLQAPDGNVEAGSKREFVDDGAVYTLKKMIHEGREVQQSLINYRKGGKPFLNLLTMIPIPWDTDEIRYFIGFQIDLVECPDAIAPHQGIAGVQVNYKHSDIGQYIWTPPTSSNWEPENGQTLGVDDVSTLLQQFNPQGLASDWHKQTWDKMLLENTDDVVHVLSLKGLFLYLSPACKRVLEYDAAELAGNSLSTVCHPSDIVPVTRELKDTTLGNPVNIVFRIRRKHSGYTWFESHGSLFVEQGKGRKCIILVGRKRPVFALSRRNLEVNGGIGDSELWTKLSTAGLFLFVSSNIRSLLDLQPENLVGTSIQDLMRKESRPEFGRSIEKARRGRTVTCKHEVQNRRGQVLQAQTTLYPGDASEGQKPSFLLAQTKLIKASSRSIAPANSGGTSKSVATPRSDAGGQDAGKASQSSSALALGTQDIALASDDNIFDELRTTKCSSWQFELRQMEKVNRILAEELGGLLSNKKKRKRRKGIGNAVRDCANCHTRNTPEWRRGPSGQRDLCNSCGLRWAKQTGRVSPRNSSRGGNGNSDAQSKKSNSPNHSPLSKDVTAEATNTRDTNGDSVVIPDQHATENDDGTNAPSGAASATGVKPSAAAPPPSQSSMMGVGPTSGMTSIREERESSQT
ncbi:White collar 1 protein [Neonectria ditissima]|uniref:White collar 1 protein n=1 Tax=Neonectria ditissima TaxID=78410 RepID=A0A0P7BA69_9HYPO|nr:White collar 1 protein [Neonectria ditissima]